MIKLVKTVARSKVFKAKNNKLMILLILNQNNK